jgi:[acyl-carrier-protein] S-malonyltransferase
MNTTAQLPGILRGVLTQPTGGIVGLVDDLLVICSEHGLQLDWQADCCRFRSFWGDWDVLPDVALPKSVFRAILARLAVLCNERNPNSVSPYGGEGELSVGENPRATFRFTFVNTAAAQKLELLALAGMPIEANQQNHVADANRKLVLKYDPEARNSPQYEAACSTSTKNNTSKSDDFLTPSIGKRDSVETSPIAIPSINAISNPRTAILFPGQGSQSVGMADSLCQSLPEARALFARAESILGYNLLEICLRGPAERLNATDVSQPAIFVASLAGIEQLKATEPNALESAVAVAGLSLGEYTALVYAGAMSFDDGVRLVQARGQAMQAAAVATPSGMISILGLDNADIEALVLECRGDGTLEIANYLCPGNTVVSGTLEAIERVEKLAQDKGGIRTIRLTVAGAFHTNLMKPADRKLAETLAGIPFNKPRVPVWSNVDAKPHTDPTEIRDLLVKQVLSPVQWEGSLRGLLAAGVERFYEVGPGRVLAGLLRRVQRKTDVRNVTV